MKYAGFIKYTNLWRAGAVACLAIASLPGYCISASGGKAEAAKEVVFVNGPLKLGDAMPAPVVYWEEVRTEPRPLRLHFMLVDLASPKVEAAVAVSDDPDGDGPAVAMLRRPIEFAKENDFFAAVNANAFMPLLDATEEENKRVWYVHKHVRPFGLPVDDGEQRNGHDDRRRPIWFDGGGLARVGKPEDGADPEQAAADWEGPILVTGGVVDDGNTNKHPRTLAGTDAKGERLLLVVAEGRKKGYSEGLTLKECGGLMLESGCTEAVNFDGGGSSVMLVTTNGVMSAVGSPQGRYLRPLPVMIGIRGM